MADTQFKTLRLFKGKMDSFKYIFKNGQVANFRNGRYSTNDPAKIQELEQEIDLGHEYIYIDPNEPEAMPEEFDPMAALREKMRQELIREGYVKPSPDSEYTQSAINPASTEDLRSVTIDSAANPLSQALMAQLKNIQTPVVPPQASQETQPTSSPEAKKA